MENHIGHNIKNIAAEKNLKPQEIAYRWKKTPQAVYDLFKNSNPKADALIEMCKVLQVSANRILGIPEGESSQVDTMTNDSKMNVELVREIKNQLKVKDEQIIFLQDIIIDLKNDK